MAYVMIVDDDRDYAGALALILRGQGHETAVSEQPAAALTQMERRPPDVLILDAMFPEDDFAGFELARAMHERPPLDRVPILMLTSINAQHQLGLSTLDTDTTWLPVAEFADKPVAPEDLAAKVAALLAAGGPPSAEVRP
jgi:CheY-like chemotaxis protein